MGVTRSGTGGAKYSGIMPAFPCASLDGVVMTVLPGRPEGIGRGPRRDADARRGAGDVRAPRLGEGECRDVERGRSFEMVLVIALAVGAVVVVGVNDAERLCFGVVGTARMVGSRSVGTAVPSIGVDMVAMALGGSAPGGRRGVVDNVGVGTLGGGGGGGTSLVGGGRAGDDL